MVDHRTVLKLARQGEAQAIAQLINQALVTKGIQVRAVRKADCLHVLLEASQLPERLTYSRIVYAAVLCLGAPSIQILQVYGRQQGEKLPAWSQAFRLKPVDAAANSQPVQPNHAPKAPVATQTATIPAKSADLVEPAKPQPVASASPPSRSKLVPVALSVCAGLGFLTGLSYLNAMEEAQETGADSGPDALTTATPQPTSTSPLDNPALATFPAASPPSAAPTPSSLAPANSPPASPMASPTATPVAVTIKAVGDIIPGSNYPGKWLPSEPGEQLAAETEMLFGNIKPFFNEADILFGNFESTLTDYPYPAKDTSQGMTFAFRTPPVYAQMLKELGFDVLSVANNHSFDFGDQGFADTINHIEQAGMKAVGKKGQIVYTTVNNVTVAFIGFSYLPDHNQMHDLATAGTLVQEAKKQAQIVVISVHAGAEGSDQVHTRDQTEYFFGEDRGNLVQFARGLVDQGADLILGHGPHVPRAVELYQGKLIAYSLGNFVGYETLSTVGTLGYSLILQAQMDANGDFIGGRIIPVALNGHGIPKLDDFFQSVVLIRNLTLTDFPQTPLRIDDMGYLLPVRN
ncbi:CapA family protein [Leptolyngbya sp. NK1-12]|uniref:CapA family protein n=1 Tax=Leptolyngbya sp. NK1-12 TaxID=2547451 RepID=A0AA96WCE8_9CYAN|nr:CapA family protein [Leptolyngbya sp. NK1-12]